MGDHRVDPNIYRFEEEILYITCTKCKVENEATNSHFCNLKKSKYGFSTICKPCSREARKRWKPYKPYDLSTKEEYLNKRKSQRLDRREFTVYKIVDKDNNILYIGKAVFIKNRIKDHVGLHSYKSRATPFKNNHSVIHKVFTKNFNNTQENTAVEAYYIAKYQPPYNKRDTMAGEPSKWLQPLAESVEWEEYDLNSLIKVEK